MQERQRSPATRRRSASWIAEAPGVGDGLAVASRLQRSGALTGLPPTTAQAGYGPCRIPTRPIFSSIPVESVRPAVDVEACRLQIDLYVVA